VAFPKLYTIGYEGASIEGLVAALQQAGVTRVLDIRYAPYSRREAFSIEALGPALTAYNIAYTHIRGLGNPPSGREAARLGHAAAYREIFTAHLNGPEGQAGLHQALAFAEADTLCLLCMERAARNCHRSMAAKALAALTGCEIAHLQIDSKSAHPAQSAFEF